VAYSASYSGSETMAGFMNIDVGAIGNSVMNTGGTIIILIVLILVALVVFLLIRKSMKYDIPVEIIEIDESGAVYKKDTAGIFFNRSGSRLFWLKKYKVGLCPDKIPYVRTTQSNSKLKFWMQQRKVFLYQYGYKNFSYVTPTISNPGIDFGVGDSDVSWGIAAYNDVKTLQIKSWVSQLIPYIPLIISSVTTMIIVIYVFKSFPQIKELIKETGIMVGRLGEVLAKTSSSGAIIVGG
jgi:large-conductance mechanosensitive channel